MKIAVCIKRTPDTTARIKPAADGKNVDPQGIEWVINPYDELAIEESLKIKGANEGSETIGVSVDPDANQTVMRKALAMGLDRAVIVKSGVVHDAYSTSVVLADALKEIGPDLVLFGKQAIDYDNYQVPSMVAQLLGMPRVNVVTKLEVADGTAKAHRQIEGGEEIVELKLPCVVSCQRGLNEPRYPSLKGIMAAKKKPLEVKEAQAPDAPLRVDTMTAPAERQAGKILADVRGKGADEIKAACRELLKLLREEAKVL